MSRLHFTIGTAPQVNGANVIADSVAHDLRLVKAALLYADGVTLCSTISTMSMMLVSMSHMSTREQIYFFEQMLPYAADTDDVRTQVEQMFALYRQLNAKIIMTAEEEADFRRLRQLFTDMWRITKQSFIDMIEESGAMEIVTLLNSGIVELHPLAVDQNSNEMIESFVGAITEAVAQGETYPLFDGQTGKLISAAIDEGLITVSDARAMRARHSNLAANVLERLPLFEAASAREIIDIRSELERHLTQFRAAMIRFSETIATQAWDDDFAMDAERIFLREVEPTVQTIENEVRSNRFLSELWSRPFGRDLVSPASGALTFVLSQASALPEATAAALGMGAAVLASVADTYRHWSRERRDIQNRNQLFFYYKTSERLRHLQT